MHRLFCPLAAALVAALAVQAPASAEDDKGLGLETYPKRSASAEGAAAEAIHLNVPSGGGTARLLLYRATARSDESMSLALRAERFVAPSGRPAEITLHYDVGAGETPIVGEADLGQIRGPVSIILKAEALAEPGPYDGALLVTLSPPPAAAGEPIESRRKVIPIRLTRTEDQGTPAVTLALDRSQVPLEVDLPFWDRPFGWSAFDEPFNKTFAVRLSAEPGGAPILGPYLSVTEASTDSVFTLNENLVVCVNGVEVENITIWPPDPETATRDCTLPTTAAQGTVSQGGGDKERGFDAEPGHGEAKPEDPRPFLAPEAQIELRFGFRDLPPGSHSAKLEVKAANAQGGEAKLLEVTIDVRDHWGWAVAVLLLSLGLSFITTRAIEIKRKRGQLMAKIDALQHPLFDSEPPSLAVVRAQSLISMARRMADEASLLENSALIDAEIAKAGKMVKLLAEAAQLRGQIAVMPRNVMVRRRALGVLNRAIGQLGAGEIDDDQVAKVQRGLTKAAEWLDPARTLALYWAEIEPMITALRREVEPQAFSDPDLRRKVEALRVSPEATPDSEEDKVAQEQRFAALKLLWWRRGADELPELSEAVTVTAADDGTTENIAVNLDRLFKVADAKTWERLRAQGDKLRFESPPPTPPSPYQALQPLRFRLATDTPLIDTSYLFKHGLRYQWTFVVPKERPGWWSKAVLGDGEAATLCPRTTMPEVIQFAPRKGGFRATLEILHPDGPLTHDAIDGPKLDLTIARSKSLGSFVALERAELISLAVAFLFAVATGLSTTYFAGETFGSFKDYLTLFLLGAGADQAKNLLSKKDG